jgi:hypothetical protein
VHCPDCKERLDVQCQSTITDASISNHDRTALRSEDVVAHLDEQIATLRDPDPYAMWMIPIVSGRVP